MRSPRGRGAKRASRVSTPTSAPWGTNLPPLEQGGGEGMGPTPPHTPLGRRVWMGWRQGEDATVA
eukprot:scaffold261_cov336-Pavlova_lutheri.AAC.30